MDDKPFETMNIIPFVDIMLVLLTIVLTTSSFIAAGRIPVNLPQATKNAAEIKEPAVMIEISLDGDLYFEGEPVSLEGLRLELASKTKENSFVIRADREITLQRFIDVADLLKQMGFGKVAVQTRNDA